MLLPVLALPFLAARRAPLGERARAYLLFAGTALVVIAPWTVRNALVFDRFLPIDLEAGKVLRDAHNGPLPPNLDLGIEREPLAAADARHPLPTRGKATAANPVDRSRDEVRAALRWNLEHPGVAVERVLLRTLEFFAPTSYLLSCLARDKYRGPPPPWLHRAIIVTAVAAYLGTFLLALLGIFALAREPGAALLLVCMAGTLAVHALTQSWSRYRLPLVPCAAIFAAAGIAVLLRRRRLARTGWFAASALAAALVAASVHLLTRYELLGWP